MRTAILLLTIHLISFGYALTCGSATCIAKDSCCDDLSTGYRCYDPTAYHCVSNDANETVLCPLKQQACGTACFNPMKFECTDGEVLCGVTSSGQPINSCAGDCYNPNKFQCCNGKLSAKSATTVCAPLKSNATLLFCSPFHQTPCAAGQNCCQEDCYDPTAQTCFDNQLCPFGNKVCGISSTASCYDPTQQECCNLQVYPIGTSVCSTAHATCCSCSCNSDIIQGISGSYTVPTPGQCSSTYIKSHFKGQLLDCPAANYKSCSSDSKSCAASIDCGAQETFGIVHCYPNGNSSSCSGSYVCGGGGFSCKIGAHAACPAQTSDQYESGNNATLTSPGTTTYEYVPPNYAGQVCCWCATGSDNVAVSAPVPSYNDCNVAYMAANDYFNYPNATCIIWSRGEFTTQHKACGLPQ